MWAPHVRGLLTAYLLLGTIAFYLAMDHMSSTGTSHTLDVGVRTLAVLSIIDYHYPDADLCTFLTKQGTYFARIDDSWSLGTKFELDIKIRDRYQDEGPKLNLFQFRKLQSELMGF
uniref:Uncharacterized protein n=1 Tax=Oryza punctata TaxID=4537 RepID=A0A0E0K2M3_ORYPU